jgi:hypothetical protein
MRLTLQHLSVFLCLLGVGLAEPDPARRLVQIQNRAYGEVLRPRNASKKEGAGLVLHPAEPWRCMTWRVSRKAGGRVEFENQFSHKSFAPTTASADPGFVVQVATGMADWRLEKVADGFWKLVEPASGLVLTAVKFADGTKVVVAPWTGTEAQQWEIRSAPAHLTM